MKIIESHAIISIKKVKFCVFWHGKATKHGALSALYIKSEVLVKKNGKLGCKIKKFFSKIQTPTQDVVPDTNLKICYKFEKFDTTTPAPGSRFWY